MIDLDQLARRTRQILRLDQVLAVGILGLQDDFVGIVASIVASDTIADDFGGGALTEGILGAAGIRAAREVNARAQGVSVRIVVAVTPSAIHLLSLPPTGANPGREVMRFDRATTTVKVKRFGLSRRVELVDSDNGQKIRLTGSLARWSAYTPGTRAVLGELAA